MEGANRHRRNSLDLIAQYHSKLHIVNTESLTNSTEKETVSTPSTADEPCHACDDTSEWRVVHDELLKTWRRQASVNLWLQTASAYYYERINNWITYPTILVSAMTSVGIFSTDNEIVRYALAGVSLFSACMSALNRQIRAAERAQEYSIKARELGKFVRDLNFLLMIEYHQRPNVREALTRIRCDFDRINDTQNEPPLSIIRMYEKNHQSIESTLYQELNELKR